MTTSDLSEKFLKEHKMRAIDINIQHIIDLFTEDMFNGLEGKDKGFMNLQRLNNPVLLALHLQL